VPVRAILIHPKDNVATVIKSVKSKERIDVVMRNENVSSLQARQTIPFAHKVALRDVKKGDAVLKYGAKIGSATKAIQQGDHVHTHNTGSNRAHGPVRRK